MTSTKRSGSKLISGSSDLTWEGAAESNSCAAGGEGGAVQDEVGGVLSCSVTQLVGGIAGGCAVHPAAEIHVDRLFAFWRSSIVHCPYT